MEVNIKTRTGLHKNAFNYEGNKNKNPNEKSAA